MTIGISQDVVLLLIIVLCMLFIAVFAILVRDFDKRFSTYLRNSSDRSRLISNQLSTIYDTQLMISSLLKPSCFESIRKYIIDPDNELLKEINTCANAVDIKCYKEHCCCVCKYRKELYAINAEEELKSIAIICNVGDIDTLISEHGNCPLHERK